MPPELPSELDLTLRWWYVHEARGHRQACVNAPRRSLVCSDLVIPPQKTRLSIGDPGCPDYPGPCSRIVFRQGQLHRLKLHDPF